MKTIRALLLLILAVSPALASEESHKAAVEKLFTVLQMPKQYETGMLAGFNMGASMGDDRLAALPVEQQNKIKAGMEKVRSKMVEIMGWPVVKDDMAAIYMKQFSEEEVNAIIAMMDTPTGQMLVSKQIALIPESMKVGQKKMQEAMPEITRIMQEAMQ